MAQSQDVAIIGAGLAGLALALSLHEQGIKSTIYESRPSPLNIGGAVMLSPNALRIFDALDLYIPIKNQGYNFDDLEFRNVAGDLIDTYAFGSEEKYGYRGSRIYRFELIDILLDAIRTQNIKIEYGRKFSKVINEGDADVTIEFTDGTTTTATLLIGADGIHSTVRKYLYPDSSHSPIFLGHAGITASVPTSNLPSSRLDKPLTIVTKSHGAFVLAPQKRDGSELLIGKQRRITGTPTREEWDAIHADKASSVAFLQANNEIFGSVATSATSNIPLDNVNIWPFFRVPPLETWASEKKRVVLVGDAAHAIPPSAGQGISQAMEDVYMLALLMGSVQKGEVGMNEALGFWQRFRQERVEGVLRVNARVDKRRLPREEGEGEIEREEWDLEWLYGIDIKAVVAKWLSERAARR